MSLQEILKLPADERLSLIEQIWDSINKDELEIPETHKRELDRRLKLINEDRAKWISYDQMKKQIKHSNF